MPGCPELFAPARCPHPHPPPALAQRVEPSGEQESAEHLGDRPRKGAFAVITLNVASLVCLFARGAGNRPSRGCLAAAEPAVRAIGASTSNGLCSLLGTSVGTRRGRGRHSPPRRRLPLAVAATPLQRPVADAGGGRFCKPRPETLLLRELRLLPRISRSPFGGTARAPGGPGENGALAPPPGSREAAEPHSGRASPLAPALPRRPRQRLRKQRAAVSAQG